MEVSDRERERENAYRNQNHWMQQAFHFRFNYPRAWNFSRKKSVRFFIWQLKYKSSAHHRWNCACIAAGTFIENRDTENSSNENNRLSYSTSWLSIHIDLFFLYLYRRVENCNPISSDASYRFLQYPIFLCVCCCCPFVWYRRIV